MFYIIFSREKLFLFFFQIRHPHQPSCVLSLFLSLFYLLNIYFYILKHYIYFYLIKKLILSGVWSSQPHAAFLLRRLQNVHTKPPPRHRIVVVGSGSHQTLNIPTPSSLKAFKLPNYPAFSYYKIFISLSIFLFQVILTRIFLSILKLTEKKNRNLLILYKLALKTSIL